MDGASRSRLRDGLAAHGMVEGVISVGRNGGFASSLALEVLRVVTDLLEVRGDGKRYSPNRCADDAFDRVNCHAAFEPSADTGTLVRRPLSAFVPTFCGRRDPARRHWTQTG